MFSQQRRNFQSRESVFSEGSEEPSASLFYSVPTLPTEVEVHESISLQTSRVQEYNRYEDEEQENELDTVFLSERAPMIYSNKRVKIYIECQRKFMSFINIHCCDCRLRQRFTWTFLPLPQLKLLITHFQKDFFLQQQ
jgi:hypothetical protein